MTVIQADCRYICMAIVCVRYNILIDYEVFAVIYHILYI